MKYAVSAQEKQINVDRVNNQLSIYKIRKYLIVK